FLSTAPAPSELSTLSLHDALPICARESRASDRRGGQPQHVERCARPAFLALRRAGGSGARTGDPSRARAGSLRQPVGEGIQLERSEEHTSELQSPYDLVCRLLLEK